MTRGIFIAGNESSLFSALGREAAKRVKSFAQVLIPHAPGEAPSSRPQTAAKEFLDWNPASPISARTLILAAQNKLGRIDEAILVCVPPAYRRPPEAVAPVEIDRLLDYNIKGWFFLVRELASLFKAGGSGSLALVLQEVVPAARGEDIPDLAGPSAAAAFRSFAQGLLFSPGNAPYAVMGFSAPEAGEENAFAAYVFKTMEEGRRAWGKWHKFGKFGLFGR